MSVSLLLITHAPLGSAMLSAVTGTLGKLPLTTTVVDIQLDANPEQELQRAIQTLDENDQGDGTIIFTDMYGSTPSNIATELLRQRHDLILISGVNLPMLLRSYNYAELPLEQLAQKAVSGGQNGIIIKQPVAGEEKLNHA